MAQQKRLVRAEYADSGWEVPRLLDEMDGAEDFYFDSISQIRMDNWSTGRVTLVGDAGYCPAPAVGGGTALAVIGAYVLAGELAAAGGDPVRGLTGYENRMRELVRRSRSIGPSSMRTLIPQTPRQVALVTQLMRLVPRLPAAVQRRLFSLQGGPARTLESITLERYEAPS